MTGGRDADESSSRDTDEPSSRDADAPTILDPVPKTPVVDGSPAFGTYRGVPSSTALECRTRGVGPVHRYLRKKRWMWFAVGDDRIAAGGAIVDAGPIGTVFCWVADRVRTELIVDASRLVPGPMTSVSDTPDDGVLGTCRLSRDPLTIERDGATMSIRGSLGTAAFDLELDCPPERAVTAICPVDGGHDGAMNVTTKEHSLDVRGVITAEDHRFVLTDGVGLFDYSHGLLARETRWDWAFGVGHADGTPISFNLVDGFNDGLENVVWLDGEPLRVGSLTLGRTSDEYHAPTAEFDDESEFEASRWRANSDCGTVDLGLAVEVVRKESIDVGILASEYGQPVGAWSGTIDGRDVEGMFGVAENHRARW